MRKRCWKTVLSAVLAAAMLVTSAPANLTMTVQAQEPSVEDTLLDPVTVQDDNGQQDDEQTGNDAGEVQDAKNRVGGGTNVVATTEGEEGSTETDTQTEDTKDNETPDTKDTSDSGSAEPDDDKSEAVATDLEGAEGGAVANGKEITFTCKPTDGFFGSRDSTNETDIPLALSGVTSIVAHGEKTPSGEWGDLVTLAKGDGGVWTGTWTAPEYGTYTYQFQAKANGNTYYMLYNNKVNLKVTVKDPDAEEVYAGPTIDYDPNSADPGAVTFYFPATLGSTEITAVKVKGSWDSSWGDKISMTKEEGATAYSVTLPTSKTGKTANIEYGFEYTGGGKTDEWSKDLENPNDNGNCIIHRNPNISETGDVTLYYYLAHAAYPNKVELKYRKKDATEYITVEMETGKSPETAVYQTTLSDLAAGTYEYHFVVDEQDIQDTNNATMGEFVATNVPKKDPSVKSPVTKDGKTTFSYFGPTANSVQIAGSMMGESDWNNGKKDMTYNEETGYWSIELVIEPGSYEYKFIVDNTWMQDPLNPNPSGNKEDNSLFTVAGLQVPPELWVKRGGSRTLPATMKLDDGKQLTSAAVTYEIPAETQEKYGDKITLTTETKENVTTTTLAVAADFPTTDKSFTLTATAQGNASEVTLQVADATYMYTIYYYDPSPAHASVDNAALWLWQSSSSGASKQIEFDEVETLADGKAWLKKTIELGYTDVSFKSKAYGSWDWEDSVNKVYVNEEKNAEVTLYAVTDDAKVYTELPEIVAQKERYLVVEYTRETKKDGKWQFYTWNSGFGGNVWVPFEAEDDILVAKVPVKPGVDSISFCLARTEGTDPWGEKDGNDYNCPVPADQNVVKIKIEEGKGITYTYPYNTGYEIDTKKGKINFYYRDDEAFLAGNKGGYADVSLELIAPQAAENAKADVQEGETSKQTVKMVYDEAEERYEYVLDQLVSGDHYYRYAKKKTADATVEYALDDFNELKDTIGETEYSVLQYALLDVEMEAEMQNATMDYNDNNVLKLKVSAKDLQGKPIDEAAGIKVVDRATVDLSAVGGGVTEIDPELLAVTIAVKQGTSAGEKILPVTIYDVYNNEYKTDVKVTVANRSKGSDFDWDEAVVYFTVTDRFFDGNASNNEGGVPGSYDKTTNDGLNSSYHGGDFAGLTQKLDYLQDLGVNTIWITPIVENQTIANSVDNSTTVTQAWGYTGYWAKDFTKLDAHLGTEAEFSALLDAAHAKGMKVMVDVVLNHTGYGDEITNYYNSNFKNEDGEVIKMLRGADEVVSGSDQMSSLSGLPDFRTEDPEVRELVVEWQSNWISKYPIDYYRVDTVKHVDDTTWSAFKNALTEINPDFKMIGEWAGAGYGTDTGMLHTGRMDALLDFDFPQQAANFVAGDLSGVEGFLSARNGAIDNTASLGSWLSNHDQQGFAKRLMNEKGKSEEEAKQLSLVAASLQLTAKGQVYIYYGEEIGVNDGEENYPYQSNRRDFDWSKVTDDNEALAHYKKMLSIRNTYSELFAKGTRNTISADNANGLDVFTRSYGGTTLTVALNIKDQEQTYTLSGQKPGTAVVDYYSGKQYTVDESGNVVITIPAAADGGTVVLGIGNFRVDLPEGSGMQIKNIPDQTYTGLSIKLSEEALQVYDGTTKLTAGVDYTVSYKNNKSIGTATVTIKGKGNYKESVTAQFNIVPVNVADLTIEYKDIVIDNGKEQKPLSKITNNGKKLSTKDYKVEYYKLVNGQRAAGVLKGVKDVGEYEMVITGLKNYTGTVTKAISVKDKDSGVYTSKLNITLEYTSIPYSGKALEPTVTVKQGTTELALGTDYTVAYSNNTNVGTANVIITGVTARGYYGSVTKTFKITGTELSKAAKISTTGWQSKVTIDPIAGKAEQENASLVPKSSLGKTLRKGSDYTVSYSNNTRPGTATVIFTGTGAYTGKLTKTFKVVAAAWKQTDLDNSLKITVGTEAPYAKKGAQAAVTVTYLNKSLTEGRDYKLTYKNNKNVTGANTQANKMPSVEVTGMGLYSGKVNAGTYKIVAADLSGAGAGITVSVPDAVYTGDVKSKPVVRDADGTYLTSGADYTVKYFVQETGGTWSETIGSNLAVNTKMKAEVTGAGSYTGTVSKEYRVVAASITKATIVARAQTYTGKAITLGEDDFTKAKIGKTKLVYGEDYEVVPGSYENNINKGNATVTLRGKGNYGGERTVTFRITSAGLRWWWNLFS